MHQKVVGNRNPAKDIPTEEAPATRYPSKSTDKKGNQKDRTKYPQKSNQKNDSSEDSQKDHKPNQDSNQKESPGARIPSHLVVDL